MNKKQKMEILRNKPFCVYCFKNCKYEKATEVSDDGTPLCKFHYKQYMNDAFAEIYYG